MDEPKSSVLNILRQPRKTHTQITSLYDKIGKIDFFRNFSNNDQKGTVYEFLSRMKLEEISAGGVVFFKGEPANKFYVVMEGEVAIFLDEEEEKQGLKECPYPIITQLHSANPRIFNQQTKAFLLSMVAVLKGGQAFGELGVMQSKPRMATVIATKNSSFGILSTEDFKATLQPALLNETDVKIKYLKAILDRVSHFDEVWRLSAFFNRVKLEKYSVLTHEDGEFSKVYIIAQGAIQLEKNICYDGDEESYLLGRSKSSEFKPRGNQRLNWGNYQTHQNNSQLHGDLRLEQSPPLHHSTSTTNRPQTKKNSLFKKTHRYLISAQPVVVYGQNQFIGFKEFMEDKSRYYFTARVLESGYGYWIHVSNLRRCVREFQTFGNFFYKRHEPLLRVLNVSQLGVARANVPHKTTGLRHSALFKQSDRIHC